MKHSYNWIDMESALSSQSNRFQQLSAIVVLRVLVNTRMSLFHSAATHRHFWSCSLKWCSAEKTPHRP
jgi:hypothetical protein